MLYMVVETFKDSNPSPIYARLAERGRMMPDGLSYVGSWIAQDFTTCYQVMETDDFGHFEQWTSSWDDLMEFKIIPVMTSAEALEAVKNSRGNQH